MPLIHNNPISMSKLNQNVDSNLLLNNTFVAIGKTLNTGNLSLSGGVVSAGKGARISLTGSDNTDVSEADGSFYLYIPAANEIQENIVLKSEGCTDSPRLNFMNLPLKALGHAVDAMDAAPLAVLWTDWSPTKTWSGATPGTISQTCRYCQIGKVVFYFAFILAADGNNCTGLTFTLPVSAKTGLTYPYWPASVFHDVNSTRTAGIGYANQTSGKFEFFNWPTWTDGVTCYVAVNGFYEAA